jgi:sugar lactone lactonase YvrE
MKLIDMRRNEMMHPAIAVAIADQTIFFSESSTSRKRQKTLSTAEIKHELLWKWKEIHIEGIT